MRDRLGLALIAVGLLLLGGWWWTRAPAPPDEPASEEPSGRWFPYRTHTQDQALTAEQRAELEQLEAIGYVGGTLPGEGTGGVRLRRPDAMPGWRFYVSGDGPVARLIDADGALLHEWRGDFWAAFPDYPVRKDHGAIENWRRARLLPDGSILAIHEGLGMVRLDADSRVMWAYPGRTHHDLHVVGDEVVALAREARVDPRVDAEKAVLEDLVVWLDLATGVERRRLSVYDAIRASDEPELLPARRARGDGDLLHTNALWLLDGSRPEPAFAAGNILLSFRETSTLAVLDPAAGRIVRSWKGAWKKQHDPELWGERLLLFDNVGAGAHARALAVDAATGATAWSWGGPPGDPLTSATLGAVEALPDGGVLVTESEGGRVWELDPQGALRWAWVNPARAGASGEYIAAVFELTVVAPASLRWAPR